MRQESPAHYGVPAWWWPWRRFSPIRKLWRGTRVAVPPPGVWPALSAGLATAFPSQWPSAAWMLAHACYYEIQVPLTPRLRTDLADTSLELCCRLILSLLQVPCSLLVSAASVSPAFWSDTSSPLAPQFPLQAVSSFRLWQHRLGLCFSECLK